MISMIVPSGSVRGMTISFFQALQQQSHKALFDIVDSIKENSITMLYGLMKVFFWRYWARMKIILWFWLIIEFMDNGLKTLFYNLFSPLALRDIRAILYKALEVGLNKMKGGKG